MLTVTATPSTCKEDHIPANNLVCVVTPISHDLITRSVSTEDDEVFIKNKCESTTEDCDTWKSFGKRLKVLLFVFIWILCSCALMVNNEKVEEMHQLSIPKNDIKDYHIKQKLQNNQVWLMVEGALLPRYYENLSSEWLQIWIQHNGEANLQSGRAHLESYSSSRFKNVSQIWRIPIVSENLVGVVPEVKHKKFFTLNITDTASKNQQQILRIRMKTNMNSNFPVSISYNLQPINFNDGVLYATLVLIGLYILIAFELVHRTVAAMFACTVAVAILAALNARPTMAEIISWIEVETLTLLFSMMILVAILSDTGGIDYLSVLAYKLTGGKVWPLITTLCLFTSLISSLLDNATTALLMTPVTIRLCELVKLDAVPILISMVIYSNLGGAITPIGDPPNFIIASNPSVRKSGVNFGVFTLHMGIGSILTIIVIYFQLRLIYRDKNKLRLKEPSEIGEIRRELMNLRKVAASISSFKHTEDPNKSVFKEHLLEKLKPRNKSCELEKVYKENLRDLEKQYPIRNKTLLIKSASILIFVIGVFFLHSIPEMVCLGLGWTALLGALLMLLLSKDDEIEAILVRVEWSTLLFFASLFILMEALSKLGLIEWIGIQTQTVIMSVDQKNRLTVAILLFLWVSAAASTFVDNLPLTTMMVKIATNLVDNQQLGLPLQPLIWALSFGACFGGNGSLFGASANIICAGVAEQHGYKFSFVEFLKVGLPVTVTSMVVITIYLLICHVVFTWH